MKSSFKPLTQEEVIAAMGGHNDNEAAEQLPNKKSSTRSRSRKSSRPSTKSKPTVGTNTDDNEEVMSSLGIDVIKNYHEKGSDAALTTNQPNQNSSMPQDGEDDDSDPGVTDAYEDMLNAECEKLRSLLESKMSKLESFNDLAENEDISDIDDNDDESDYEDPHRLW